MNQLQDYFYTVKSDKSKQTYEIYIRFFEEWSKSTLMDLIKLEPKEIQDKLIEYVKYMRDKKLSYSSIKGRMSPLIRFIEHCEIIINKRKIKQYYGEDENQNTVEDKAYTTEEIAKMLSVSKLRTKTMILVYSSTGIRRDAIIELKLKHLTAIPEYNLYKFTIYPNSKKYRYETFCTQECKDMIDQYLEQRRQSGELINKESYLIRNDYNYSKKETAQNPKPITSGNLNFMFRNLVVKTGLRAQNKPANERKEIALFNGYRKRFNTTLVDADVKHLFKEKFMGHSIGLDKHYFRPEEMLSEYVKALDKLSISQENRLKVKVEKLEIENSRIDDLQAQIDRILKQQRK